MATKVTITQDQKLGTRKTEAKNSEGIHIMTSITRSLPVTAVLALCPHLVATAGPFVPVTLVEHQFDGGGVPLNGVGVVSEGGIFDAAITSAGGSGTWAAGSSFLANGVVEVDGGAQNSAYLNLGSYINDAKGTAAGLFELTYTVSPTAGEWISLGFSVENTPSTTRNFTNTTGAGGSTTGIATIIRREVGDWDLDMIGGPTNSNRVDGPEPTDPVDRTLSVTLDFTPAGGWNGTTNWGTVTWSDSVLDDLGSHTYTDDYSFGAILITEANVSGGTISNLSLTGLIAVPEPSTAILAGLGLLGVTFRKIARSMALP